MSSRYALDSRGRRIVVVTTPSLGQDVGDRFLVLGNSIGVDLPDERGRFYFLGTPTGRRNGVTRPRRTNRDPLPLDAPRDAQQ